jgi:hypothetical protein
MHHHLANRRHTMSEKIRGCGYRKIGGLYLVNDGPGVTCEVLPYPLEICPTCSAGIKFCRGWTWVSSDLFVFDKGDCNPCPLIGLCPMTNDDHKMGLLWVGKETYTVESFSEEAARMGISRRIQRVPRGFVLGETWVLLAHLQAVRQSTVDQDAPLINVHVSRKPGVFQVFRPTRIEYLVTQEMLTYPQVRTRIDKQQLTPVVVPDTPRHQ